MPRSNKKKSANIISQRPPWPPPEGNISYFIVYLLFFFTSLGNRSMPGSKSASTLPIKSFPIIPDGNALYFIIVS